MVEPGIEPGTSWLVVRSSDHQATRLVTILLNVETEICNKNYLETGVFGFIGILAFVGTCTFLKFDTTSSGFAFN